MASARPLFEWLRDVERAASAAGPVPQVLIERGAGLTDPPEAVTALVTALVHQGDAGRRREAWLAAVEAYEALRAERVERGERLPGLKPTNLRRNVFHVGMALAGVVLYELVAIQWVMVLIAGVATVIFAGIEVARRRSPEFNDTLMAGSFGALSRPSERREIPGGAWFALGALIGAITLPQKAVEIGFLVLGFGDPVASLVGKRFGRIRLLGERTLAGTLAFTIAGAAAVAAFSAVALPDASLAVVLLPAVAGAVTELLSGPVNDNLSVSLVAGAVAAALL